MQDVYRAIGLVLDFIHRLVQNKPNSSVQHTPSSESFQVYAGCVFTCLITVHILAGLHYFLTKDMILFITTHLILTYYCNFQPNRLS
jgi:hypothetical protein